MSNNINDINNINNVPMNDIVSSCDALPNINSVDTIFDISMNTNTDFNNVHVQNNPIFNDENIHNISNFNDTNFNFTFDPHSIDSNDEIISISDEYKDVLLSENITDFDIKDDIYNGYDSDSDIDGAVNSLKVITWNIGGFTSNDKIVMNAKNLILNLIVHSFKPDIINILEGRVHYAKDCKKRLIPRIIKNYFCHIGDQPLYDPKLKTITYYHKKHKGNVRKIHITPTKISTGTIEHNHWSTWSVLESSKNSVFQHPIINAAYYRSPKPGNKDVIHLLHDLEQVYLEVPHQKRIIINTDINIHAPDYALKTKLDFNNAIHKSEFKILQKLLNKYKMHILNEENTPTHYYKNKKTDNIQKGSA